MRIMYKPKYRLLNMQKLKALKESTLSADKKHLKEIRKAMDLLERFGILENNNVNSPDEAFVIKLKDTFARPALRTYAKRARRYDAEYASDVFLLAQRAGRLSPFCKLPD